MEASLKTEFKAINSKVERNATNEGINNPIIMHNQGNISIININVYKKLGA
jgi:hypothetical protein